MKVYILYKNDNVKVPLDMSYNINDIIESLGYCIDCSVIDYSIVEKIDTTEKEIVRIKSVDDYARLRYLDNRLVLKKD